MTEKPVFACPKQKKPIRLKGKAKKDLELKVWERDKDCCLICGKPLPEGHIAHHIEQKSDGGQDTVDNLVQIGETGICLCGAHTDWHHAGLSIFIDKVIYYLGEKKVAQAILRGLIITKDNKQ
jgi:hypothetical protein